MCLASFPNFPGVHHVCIDFVFLDADLWVYRDGSWLLASGEQHQTQPPAPPGTLPVSKVRQGKLSAADFSTLSQALARVGIATAEGGCTPFSAAPPLPELPAPDLHYQIVWYGKDFRHNVVTLGTEFPDACSQDITDLVNDLLRIESVR